MQARLIASTAFSIIWACASDKSDCKCKDYKWITGSGLGWMKDSLQWAIPITFAILKTYLNS